MVADVIERSATAGRISCATVCPDANISELNKPNESSERKALQFVVNVLNCIDDMVWLIQGFSKL